MYQRRDVGRRRRWGAPRTSRAPHFPRSTTDVRRHTTGVQYAGGPTNPPRRIVIGRRRWCPTHSGSRNVARRRGRGVVGAQQIEHAAVFRTRLSKNSSFASLARAGCVDSGKASGSARGSSGCGPSALRDESLSQAFRLRIGQHAAHLARQIGGRPQFAARRGVDELVVRNAFPQEKDSVMPAPVADPYLRQPQFTGRSRSAPGTTATRGRFHRQTDAALESAVARALPIELQQFLEIRRLDGPPVGPPRQSTENTRGTGLFLARGSGSAGEDPPAARRVGGRRLGVRARNHETFDARVAGVLEKSPFGRCAQRHPFRTRRRRVRERHGDDRGPA